LAGVARRGDVPGWNFQLALEVLQHLREERESRGTGLSLEGLALRMRVEALQLEEPVAAMVLLDWLGRLDEEDERYVLLVDLEKISLAPLVERLLLAHSDSTARFWTLSQWRQLTVAQALQTSDASGAMSLPGSEAPEAAISGR
ncbi:MAG: hypothetical protein C0453_11340, partial [Comamonadaceae bacterium]|nr:hypothetical protein [Comamonadaceae bacterium]